MSDESDTPETDAKIDRVERTIDTEWSYRDFARTLERRAIAAEQSRDEWLTALKHIKDALAVKAIANEQAAIRSPQHADWSNGVARGLREAIDFIIETQSLQEKS